MAPRVCVREPRSAGTRHLRRRRPRRQPRRIAGVAGRDDYAPAWSPNGKQIAYRLNPPRSDDSDIMVVAAERRHAPQPDEEPRRRRLVAGLVAGRTLDRLLLRCSAGGRDIWVMRPDGIEQAAAHQRRVAERVSDLEPGRAHDRVPEHAARRVRASMRCRAQGRRQRNLSRHPARRPVGGLVARRALDRLRVDPGRQRRRLRHAPGRQRRRGVNLTRTPELEESHPAWAPSGELTFTRHGETGPIELWSMTATGEGARRLDTPGRTRLRLRLGSVG